MLISLNFLAMQCVAHWVIIRCIALIAHSLLSSSVQSIANLCNHLLARVFKLGCVTIYYTLKT